MRAALFLAAGLILGACSSSFPPSSADPQRVNANGWATRASSSGNQITLKFEDAQPASTMTLSLTSIKCITSVYPEVTEFTYGVTTTVQIVADTQGRCTRIHAFALFDAEMQRSSQELWKGLLNVLSAPKHSDRWEAAIIENSGPFQPCEHPPLPRPLHDGELINFYARNHACHRR